MPHKILAVPSALSNYSLIVKTGARTNYVNSFFYFFDKGRVNIKTKI